MTDLPLTYTHLEDLLGQSTVNSHYSWCFVHKVSETEIANIEPLLLGEM